MSVADLLYLSTTLISQSLPPHSCLKGQMGINDPGAVGTQGDFKHVGRASCHIAFTVEGQGDLLFEMKAYTLLRHEFLYAAHMGSREESGTDCGPHGLSTFAKDEVKAGGSTSAERSDHATDSG